MGGLVHGLKTVTLVTASFGVVLCGFLVSSAIVEDDVKCLEGVRSNLSEPQGQLRSWNFANSSVGFICNFVEVTCWNDRENRVISLRQHGMKLSGQIPESFKYCQSMMDLNLLSNALFDNIPPQICTWLPYLTTLDLSNNELSGAIPADLGNCSYLNVLILSNNRLSGSTPIEFSNFTRLKKLCVANNDLIGTIPSSFGPSSFRNFNASDFTGNDICGVALGKRGGLRKKNLAIIIAAGICGAAAGIAFVIAQRKLCN